MIRDKLYLKLEQNKAMIMAELQKYPQTNRGRGGQRPAGGFQRKN